MARTCLGLAILVTLAGIGTSSFLVWFLHAPAVFAARAKAEDKAKPVESLIVIPEGIRPLAPAEFFHSDNLYEKINGQAELYLSADFVSLRSQSFVKADDPDFLVDLFVYDMGNVLNAFAVFSTQRREESKSLKLGQFSYKSENALFLVHGPYYVEIIASANDGESFEVLGSIARNFIRENQVEVKPIAERWLFPSLNLIKESISLIPSNAFGYDALNRVFTARYRLGDNKVTAFISHRESALEAQQLALKYHEFLKQYGGKNVGSEIGIKGARIVKIAEAYEVIFTHGPYLAGIHEAIHIEQAEDLAEAVKKKLEENVAKR